MSPSNLLLASLSPSDLAALEPRLKPASLQQMQTLYEAGDPISTVYFPTGAIISLVVALSTGEIVEAAMVGRDGVVGASSALDGKISLSRAIVQLSGPSLTCDVGVLKTLAMQSQSLLSLLIRHEQALYAQAQQSTACMASHHTDARFCRWMLRARDLSGSDTLNFTQEFLAEMLGVGRTHVTLVAHTLQAAGIIKYTRGKIHILDLEALREAACECYDTVNSNYRALLGGQY
ncbi:Crp/Fnr family transcriptional regulator [Bradyrhizobium sp. WSM 1791]|uniref:Crp/Fnr family transcriptional regulator n=1 Tax=Bradyrhizobium australiense TaxID=2721161 RepID=A0A7Y4LU19_9BRAD|nr:Crp/Fnr family transcriptional regulator [Bradyrhizobium australiense]